MNEKKLYEMTDKELTQVNTIGLVPLFDRHEGYASLNPDLSVEEILKNCEAFLEENLDDYMNGLNQSISFNDMLYKFLAEGKDIEKFKTSLNADKEEEKLFASVLLLTLQLSYETNISRNAKSNWCIGRQFLEKHLTYFPEVKDFEEKFKILSADEKPNPSEYLYDNRLIKVLSLDKDIRSVFVPNFDTLSEEEKIAIYGKSPTIKDFWSNIFLLSTFHKIQTELNIIDLDEEPGKEIANNIKPILLYGDIFKHFPFSVFYMDISKFINKETYLSQFFQIDENHSLLPKSSRISFAINDKMEKCEDLVPLINQKIIPMLFFPKEVICRIVSTDNKQRMLFMIKSENALHTQNVYQYLIDFSDNDIQVTDCIGELTETLSDLDLSITDDWFVPSNRKLKNLYYYTSYFYKQILSLVPEYKHYLIDETDDTRLYSLKQRDYEEFLLSKSDNSFEYTGFREYVNGEITKKELEQIWESKSLCVTGDVSDNEIGKFGKITNQINFSSASLSGYCLSPETYNEFLKRRNLCIYEIAKEKSISCRKVFEDYQKKLPEPTADLFKKNRKENIKTGQYTSVLFADGFKEQEHFVSEKTKNTYYTLSAEAKYYEELQKQLYFAINSQTIIDLYTIQFLLNVIEATCYSKYQVETLSKNVQVLKQSRSVNKKDKKKGQSVPANEPEEVIRVNTIHLNELSLVNVIPKYTNSSSTRSEQSYQYDVTAHKHHYWCGSRKNGTRHLETRTVQQYTKNKDKPKKKITTITKIVN